MVEQFILETLNSKYYQYYKNKANSTLHLNTSKYVNCSDDAIIKVTFERGNNILNAI